MNIYLVVIMFKGGKCHEVEVAASSPHAAERLVVRELPEEEACAIRSIEVFALDGTETEQQAARRKCKCP